MSNTYELASIKDIFDRVPSDRIQDCCRELGLMLAQAKVMQENAVGFLGLLGVEASDDALVRIPDTFRWVDDGKGDVTIKVGAELPGGQMMRLGELQMKVAGGKP